MVTMVTIDGVRYRPEDVPDGAADAPATKARTTSRNKARTARRKTAARPAGDETTPPAGVPDGGQGEDGEDGGA